MVSRSDDHQIFRRASRSTFVLIALGVAFAAGGVALVQQGYGPAGWGVTVMFGAMAVVAFVTVLPGSTQLEVDASGFWTTTLFKKGARIGWDEVAGFETTEVAGKRVAGFRLRDGSSPTQDRAGAPLPGGGLDGVFRRDYGLGAEELAERLNEYRSRHVGAPG